MKRLTPATVTVMMVCVVGGLVAAYVAKGLMAVEEPAAATLPTRGMPMALSEITPGTVITEEHLGTGPMLVENLTPDMLASERAIVGRVAKERILPANAIRSSQLYGPGETPELEIEPGQRAITIHVSESTQIVDGLIRPGNYVDVHFTPDSNNNDPRMGGGMTMTLFKGVKVLSINRRFQQANVDPRNNNVTVSLSPRQSNIIVLAQERGQLTLSYNPGGAGIEELAVGAVDRVMLEEILGLRAAPKPAEPFRAEIFMGPSRSVLHFRDGRRLDSNSSNGSGGAPHPLQDRGGSDPGNAAPVPEVIGGPPV